MATCCECQRPFSFKVGEEPKVCPSCVARSAMEVAAKAGGGLVGAMFESVADQALARVIPSDTTC